MTSERKIIFECKIGSHLYGTSTENSDEDFQGIFLPSEKDLLGLTRSPRELTSGKKQSLGDRNQAGDIDRDILPQCHLPKDPDIQALEELCIRLQRRHILGDRT